MATLVLPALLLIFATTLRADDSSMSFEDGTGWQQLSTTSTRPQVTTYSKPFPGTRLVAFRGVAVLDAHISAAMGLFCDFRLAHQWVDMLESIRALDVESTNSTDTYMDCRPDGALDTVHQVVKLPWPLSRREILLQRRWAYEYSAPRDPDVAGTVTVRYQSVLDDRAPLPLPGANTVRAESPHTLWRFQALRPPSPTVDDGAGNGTCAGASAATRVEVQVIVDSKGSIPMWLINQVQRRWPLTALAAFDRLVQAGMAVAQGDHRQAAAPFLPVAHW